MRFACYYVVSVKGAVRFESVFQVDAETFARQVYSREGIIVEIHEVQRR
jgi:hypothetical protein